jgi:electron transfer flavoprotein alpha subunit
MTRTLIIAEHRQGEILPATHECVTAAQILAVPVTLAVIGGDRRLAESAAAIAGVSELIWAAGESPEFDSDATRAIADELLRLLAPKALLAPHSVQSMNYLAAVAARHDIPLLTDVTHFTQEGETILVRRPFYAGKVTAEIAVSRPTVALTLRAGSWEVAAMGGPADIREMTFATGSSRTRHLEYSRCADDGIDIAKAPILLSIGRGIGEADAIERFATLAEKIGATLSVSRPLVDAGWMPVSRQVGQSGKSVAPKLYLAFGISGAPQHLAGLKKAGTIVAINKDPEAPIFGVAHYGAHCDLHEVADELERLLP